MISEKQEANKNLKPSWLVFRENVHSGGGQWLTRWYHHGGACLAYGASRMGFTPNQVTMASAGVVFLAMFLLLSLGMGSLLCGIGVCILLMLAYMLDCADGQLARATGQCSKLGVWLDHVMDAAKIFLIHFSTLWLLWTNLEVHKVPALVCFLAMVVNVAGSALYFFAWNYKVMMVGDGLIGRMADGVAQKRMRWLKHTHQFTDYGWFPLLFLLLAAPKEFSVVYACYGVGCFVIFMGYIAISAKYMSILGNE